MAAARLTLRDRADRPGRPGAAPLHQRHHRHAQRAVHVHEAVVAHHITGKFALDLHPDDIFWCTADPGWVTGTSYGIIAPLTNGITSIIDEADFDAERWYGILQKQEVTVWYTAPTAIRMMMKVGHRGGPRQYDLRRCASSPASASRSTRRRWSGAGGVRPPFHDNWWQTETGGIMIANYAAMDIRPGSMGRPLPGIEAAIVRTAEDGRRRGDRRAGRRRRTGAAARLAVDVSRLPGTSPSAIASASRAAGTSPATSRGAIATATSGSSGATTT